MGNKLRLTGAVAAASSRELKAEVCACRERACQTMHCKREREMSQRWLEEAMEHQRRLKNANGQEESKLTL